MIAAHEKIKENKAILDKSKPPIGLQFEKTGAQTGTNEKSSNTTENMPSCSKTENITKSVLSEQSEENVVNKRKIDKKGSKEYETKEIWALVHNNYISSGRIASALMLQKRWYEMKQRTRALLAARKLPPELCPALLALGKRFPYILTEKLQSWSELVKNNKVFQDADLESYKTAYSGTRLEVPSEISEDILFDDLYDWSDDEVEVIDEEKETITINDSDDEQTDTRTNETTIDKNLNELNVDEDNVIKKLESIDPTTTKVKIIFEDDSDSDVNDFINETNVNISENTKSNLILDNTESFNVKSEKTFHSDENNSNTNDCNKDILVVNKQSSEVRDIKTEINKIVDNSVSLLKNQIETKRQDEVGNRNEDVNINVDNLMNDLHDMLTEQVDKLSSYCAKKIIQMQNETRENDLNTKLDIADIKSNIENNFEKPQSFNDNDSFDNDNESGNDGPGKQDPALVDEKLVKLTHVVLTPIEHIPAWWKYSKNGTINCRRFSVKNFARTIYITSDQLKNCRRYTPKTSSNGISISKNREIDLIPKDLRRKRNILTRRLKLSRTSFSGAFWSERNCALAERCRPLAVTLARAPGAARAHRRIALADIDEVRRLNSTLLTAQVAPITAQLVVSIN
ncbi:unnamed protein product [Euphydryas editha]|uniref:Uncharacterized protein n=1 Tax=Euphydryas editha TaxID=104508 RepID=A0AAU9TEE5_EUPED|nr:unnamed protein product [Euphydryas editha]